MSRFLIATWDGAGNLVPTLALARRLARAGHDVRLLGHRSIERRCGSHGWRFLPFARTLEVDSAATAGSGGDMSVIARELWLGESVALDVRDELKRESADVLIADCMLGGALSAGERAGVPTVALFHGAFALFRRGPVADLFSMLLPSLNTTRAAIGLATVRGLSEVHDACALAVVATPREFEPDIPLPGNIRFAGPLLDAPPLTRAIEEDVLRVDTNRTDGTPLIVASLSTSDQGQLPLLRRLVRILSTIDCRAIVTTGPAIDPGQLRSSDTVQVVRYVPHDLLLPRASLVMTHAGLGTVMASLAHGVPLLCLPFGRDQFFNAARVEALGVGKTIDRDAPDEAIRGALETVLQDARARAAAGRFAELIRSYRNGGDAVKEIEHLAQRRMPTNLAGTRHEPVARS
jgi:UDP:flavonoid glycosyltransferase YjiC (YdhE family)